MVLEILVAAEKAEVREEVREMVEDAEMRRDLMVSRSGSSLAVMMEVLMEA